MRAKIHRVQSRQRLHNEGCGRLLRKNESEVVVPSLVNFRSANLGKAAVATVAILVGLAMHYL